MLKSNKNVFLVAATVVFKRNTIRYDTIEEFNVDSKAKYSALSSTRSQKKKLKQTTPWNFMEVLVL